MVIKHLATYLLILFIFTGCHERDYYNSNVYNKKIMIPVSFRKYGGKYNLVTKQLTIEECSNSEISLNKNEITFNIGSFFFDKTGNLIIGHYKIPNTNDYVINAFSSSSFSKWNLILEEKVFDYSKYKYSCGRNYFIIWNLTTDDLYIHRKQEYISWKKYIIHRNSNMYGFNAIYYISDGLLLIHDFHNYLYYIDTRNNSIKYSLIFPEPDDYFDFHRLDDFKCVILKSLKLNNIITQRLYIVDYNNINLLNNNNALYSFEPVDILDETRYPLSSDPLFTKFYYFSPERIYCLNSYGILYILDTTNKTLNDCGLLVYDDNYHDMRKELIFFIDKFSAFYFWQSKSKNPEILQLHYTNDGFEEDNIFLSYILKSYQIDSSPYISGAYNIYNNTLWIKLLNDYRYIYAINYEFMNLFKNIRYSESDAELKCSFFSNNFIKITPKFLAFKDDRRNVLQYKITKSKYVRNNDIIFILDKNKVYITEGSKTLSFKIRVDVDLARPPYSFKHTILSSPVKRSTWLNRSLELYHKSDIITKILLTYTLLIITINIMYIIIMLISPSIVIAIYKILKKASYLSNMHNNVTNLIEWIIYFGLTFYIKHPKVMDAWINKRFSTFSKLFLFIPSVAEREEYVPTSISIKRGKKDTLIAHTKPEDIREMFKSDRSILTIVGCGGCGKSILAFQIARWAQSDIESHRIAEHKMIPVLLEDECNDIMKYITDYFSKVLGNKYDEDFDSAYIKVLLRKKRILFIVDSLSEKNIETQNHIKNIHGNVQVNAMIITSRTKIDISPVEVTEIRPLEKYDYAQSAEFIEKYIEKKEYDKTLNPAEINTIENIIYSIFEKRSNINITPLFLKLFTDNSIEVKNKNKDIEKMPLTMPETIIRNIVLLNPQKGPDCIPNRDLIPVTKIIAKAILGDSYTPGKTRFDELVNCHLNNFTNPCSFIDRLVKNGVLQTSEVGGLIFISFNNDPIAEYLTALYFIEEFKNDRNKWNSWKRSLEKTKGYPKEMKGFLIALFECIDAYKNIYKIPEIKFKKINNILKKNEKKT